MHSGVPEYEFAKLGLIHVGMFLKMDGLKTQKHKNREGQRVSVRGRATVACKDFRDKV